MKITKEQVEAIINNYEGNHDIFGIRFESKERQIGEICEPSKHNIDREDEWEMPEYGTEEYDNLFQLDGTSAHDVDGFDYKSSYDAERCYIIAGSQISNRDDAIDDDEVVIVDAEVIGIIK